MKTQKFLFASTLLFAFCFTPIQAKAADHGDAPGVRVQENLDINDVYLFQSPVSSANVVMIMTVSPVAGITGPLAFEKNGKYEFVIDNNGDAKPDLVYAIKFSGAAANGDQRFTLTRSEGRKAPKKLVSAGHLGFEVPVKDGGSIMADNFDDPFFFDLLSFRNSLSFCTSSARNFFNGLNTLAIVLELPISSVIDGNNTSFGVWARTFETTSRSVRGNVLTSTHQFDRNGRPAINTVLVTAANKDKFNKASPITDRARFEADGIAIMQALGNSASGAQTVGDILFPDILTINLASATAFPNGRALTDDVIDTSLQLVTGNNAATDCIATDSSFRSVFPYLAVKNP